MGFFKMFSQALSHFGWAPAKVYAPWVRFTTARKLTFAAVRRDFSHSLWAALMFALLARYVAAESQCAARAGGLIIAAESVSHGNQSP